MLVSWISRKSTEAIASVAADFGTVIFGIFGVAAFAAKGARAASRSTSISPNL